MGEIDDGGHSQPPLDDVNGLFETVGVPSAADQLFKGGDDWQNDAVLAHGHGDRWFVYATGYKDAADIIVNHVRHKQRHQDFLVYPVMFLYRQYLELTIKCLIRAAWTLLDRAESDDLGSHNIKHYWFMCQALLNEVSPGDSVEELSHIGRLIDEFCQHDPTSFAFRYPVTKPDKTTKTRASTLTALKVINLHNVQDVIGKMAVLLSGADAQIGHYMDCKRDMAGYYGPDTGEF